MVRHTCDVPKCINPDHLILGTQKDNMQDAVNRGRIAKRHGKLSDMAGRVIRRLGETKTMTHQEIANIWKVSRPAVTMIINRTNHI